MLPISATLFLLAGINGAQPPTAPVRRPVDSSLARLTFTYSGPGVKTTPKLDLVAKDGKIEVRWKMEGESCSAIATSVVVNGDVVSFSGTAKDPVVMTWTKKTGEETVTGLQIEMVLSEGKIKVVGTGTITLPK